MTVSRKGHSFFVGICMGICTKKGWAFCECLSFILKLYKNKYNSIKNAVCFTD